MLVEGNRCSRRRSANPINEFEDNEWLIAGVFPHIFLFGTLYGNKYKQGVLPTKCRHHLVLFQYTTRPARCKELILLLSNQILQHSNLQSVSLSLTNADRNECMKEFIEFVNSDDFDEALHDACENHMDPSMWPAV